MAIPLLLLGLTFATAGRPSQTDTAPAASRIVHSIDDQHRILFLGNTHPAAVQGNDRGAVEPDLPMSGVRILLKRSAEQEASLKVLMAQQSDRKSPNFHRWLTPDEFGTRFGPSNADLAAITKWLSNQGLVVTDVDKGRTSIGLRGPAARIAQAFHTEIHRYRINGQDHIANAVDPSIPAALSPVVGGVTSLNDFFAKPLHRDLGAVKRSSATGKWVPIAAQSTGKSRAQLSVPSYGYELVSPSDFATLYNLLPLWNAGIDGTGQTIAIAGRSDVKLADVASFRAAFGLPTNVPQVIVNGTDPGTPSADDQLENTLDIEWSGAVAKGAQIIFVTTASTYTDDGAYASARYIIENRIAPVMSFSYGLCELDLGAGGNAAYNALWQQAAAEGISVFVASGDAGAAGCDAAGSSAGAQYGLAVSGISSTPYNTAVGGTDLNWVNLPGNTFWANGGSLVLASALQYIPEVPWNSTCASLAYQQRQGNAGAGLDSEQFCNYLWNSDSNAYSLDVVGGGGGMSGCTNPTGSIPSSCAGGYQKPSWQIGTGVPADGHRDVPDVSLFAANGLLSTAYVICDSELAPCDYTDPSDAIAQAVGGTSVASPAMAGIMALVNQRMGASPGQGNANIGLYALAAQDNRASCNSATVAAGNACNFYDITTDSNAVPCMAGTPDCVVLYAGDSLGILAGNQSTVGYDTATGLGTVNGANLVNNWYAAFHATSRISVPNTVGSTQIAAAAALLNAGLVVGAVTQQSSTSVASDSVISQSPGAGSMVDLSSSVSLVISNGAPIAVPNEVGLTQASATTSLRNAGVAVGTIMTIPNGCYAAGIVMSQSPAAGSLVSAGSSVNLNVAGAAAKVTVARVTGDPAALASSILSNQGLSTGAVTRATSTTVNAGYVISQSPGAGTSVASCSSVALVVSSGPPPLVKIPNEVGHTQAAAVSALVGAELILGGVTQQASSSVAEGDVISQSPAGGSSAVAGTRVSLVISSGKPKVTIPSEVGDTQAVAIAALQRAGLVAGVLTHATSTHIAAGSVISETPAAGTVVVSGSTVSLVISTGRPVVQVPNESGMTQAQATASLAGKDLVVGTITRVASTVAAGKVVSQSPVSGSSVPEGTAVALKISSGPSKVAGIVSDGRT